jgi:DNA-binding HxlR family transcriptional regulator
MKRFCEHLCPNFQAAMDVLAKPWNGVIIASLASGPRRFGELLEQLEAIGDRMLSARLKELADRGLVERRVLPGPPVRVEYELTDVGQGFRQVADAIGTWGEKLSTAPAVRRKQR